MRVTVRDLIRILKAQLILGDPRSYALKAVVDSRLSEEGALFFALKGDKVDGHDFALAACKKGAAGVVVARVDWLQGATAFQSAILQVSNPLESLQLLAQYHRNTFKGPVIGITGSNGKTTTKQMVSSVMKTQGDGLFTIGNYNSQIGLPLILCLLEKSHQWMVLEMGASAPGNITSLCDIARPTVGILTSIGPAHLASFGSLQNIARTKWELMDSLPSDGTAILPWGESLLEPHIRSFKKKIVFFGEEALCPVRATSIESGEQVKFLLHIGSQNRTVRLPVGGRCNVGNALAAAAAGWTLGYPIEKIVEGLESFEPSKMRMEVIRHSSGAILINDAYNANPASMTHAVHSLVESYPGRKHTLVLGSMMELGEDSEKYHFHLGTELAKFNVDKIILTGEETKAVMEGALSAGGNERKFFWIASKDEITHYLKPQLQAGTVLLFKGSRSMELEKIIDGLKGS